MTSVRDSRTARLDLELLLGAVVGLARDEGISLREVGRRLDISPGTLSRLKSGRAPDAFALTSLLAWLDMPAARLLREAPSTISSTQHRGAPLPDYLKNSITSDT